MRTPLLQSKSYLYATEFFAGMAVMAVELGASRLLAPYFSSSQIVWTIIIGTIMIAMALGNIWGGRLADKDANPAKLYRRILLASLWIAAIPVLGKYVIVGIAGLLVVTIDTHLLIWAAFLSCMAIFVYPLFLLGTVTPCLVKYATDSLEHNGRIVGNLGAFQTIGSIIGTFLPTFVTIPAVGTAVTFLLFSGILFVISLLYFLSVGIRKNLAMLSVLLFVLCGIWGNESSFAFWETGLAYEGESIYNYLQVRDTEQSTILSTNVIFGVQSIHQKDGKLTGMYYDYALAAPLLAAQNKSDLNVLVLGMGTGTFAQECKRYFPQARITGVEIDEKITALSHRYFAMDETVPVVTYDGRAFLQATDGEYDVILVDAYQDITIPFQMSSVEFFRLVKEHLSPRGVMVVNMNMRAQGEGNINACLTDTIGEAFPAIRTVDARDATNRVLFAAKEDSVLESLASCAKELEDEDFKRIMQETAGNWQQPTTGNHILTDDKAPVEMLGMKAIDSIIARELAYYKEIYRQKGLDGLMEAL